MREFLADEFLDIIGIDVACHGHGHQRRVIPIFVIIADGLRRSMSDDGGITYRYTVRVTGIVEQLHDQFHAVACLRTATR